MLTVRTTVQEVERLLRGFTGVAGMSDQVDYLLATCQVSWEDYVWMNAEDTPEEMEGCLFLCYLQVGRG